MQKTGIVRKIDNLGRIVLPKELRYSMSIHSGDDFEIILSGENIVLKKYSKIISNQNQINNLIKIFNNNINFKMVIIVGKNIVGDDELINRDIEKLIYDRKVLKNIQILNITDKVKICSNNILLPIINNGDLLGTIICYGDSSLNIMERISNIFIELVKEQVIE